MNSLVTYIDEVPEGEGPYERGLWAEARSWVNWLLIVFGGADGIARIGLTRRLALVCRNWLWSIEGMVRRLIIAAALALDVSQLAPIPKPKRNPLRPAARPAQPQPEQETKERKTSAAFRIFSIHRRRQQFLVITWERLMAMKPRRRRTPRGPLPLHRHLSFPIDDLLLIGAADIPRKHKPGLRRRSPLDRRGRISRWDPDYKGCPEEELASYNRHFFGPFPQRIHPFDRPPEDRREPKPRGIHDPHRIGSGFEFRRLAEEWARIIPAPDLAGRIVALARVMEKPERFIERLARQLHASAGLAKKLLATPAPKLKKPKRDPTPIPPGLDLLDRCHAALPRLDSS